MSERIVDEFLKLVQIDACYGDERAVADVLIGKLKELGFSVTEDDTGSKVGGNAGNVTGILEGTLPGSLFFTSHMDRMPNGYGIKPKFEGSRIVSDGTTILAADDLSGVAAILEGVRRVVEEGLPHPRLEVVFCVGEEPQLRGSKHYDFSQLKSKIGFALDSPGRIGRVINAAPSTSQLYFDVYGKTAHAGNCPELGINALAVAGKILSTINQGRIDPETTSNFGICEAGNCTNKVCDHVHVEGETRSSVHEKMEAYGRYFEEFCQKAVEGTGARVETKVAPQYKCFYIPEESQTIQLVKEVFDSMGIQMKVERGGGGMDINRFNEYGMSCVGLATGYFQNHTNQEYIEVEDLIRSGEMVKQLILHYKEG